MHIKSLDLLLILIRRTYHLLVSDTLTEYKYFNYAQRAVIYGIYEAFMNHRRHRYRNFYRVLISFIQKFDRVNILITIPPWFMAFTNEAGE